MKKPVIPHTDQLLREQFPGLLLLYSGFKAAFRNEDESKRFDSAIADWHQEFLSIRRCMKEARDRCESAQLDLRYLEFVSTCYSLKEEVTASEIRLPRDDHYAGFVQTASWWTTLNRLADSLNGLERTIYSQRLLRCHAQFQVQLTCLSRWNTRATQAELHFEHRRIELLARMQERSILPESLDRL